VFLLYYLANLPPKVITLIVSAFPIIELRGAIPLAMLKLGLTPWEAFSCGVLGSLIPVFPILYLLQFIEPLLRKIKSLDILIDKVFEKTRSKSKIIQEWEFIGLVLFIGIPLPGTGVWTGTLAAYLFGLSKPFSFIAALIGTALAGTLMVFFSSYIEVIIEYFLYIAGLILLLYVVKKIRKK